MTTCTPIKPFRCWQFRKDSTEAVPPWVTGRVFYDQHWYVDVLGWVSLYTPAEFAERFRVEEGK
jgi:hypothetical protein